jgi:two-component system, NarL family, nitrate/nitrite response regulator NarL
MDNQTATITTVSKILIVDDHILFREGLMSLFRFAPDFEVVGGAGGVFEGIEQARLHRPDIILMDFSLPDGTGLEATRAILAQLPECKIVFLTVYETDEKLFAAVRTGAKGYLMKSVASSDLLASLRAVVRGERAISRRMMNSILDEFSNNVQVNSDKEKLLARLSPREVDVLCELESGATNLEIAQRLFLSENTIKHHIRNILDKLELENRREAAIFARKNELLSKFSNSGGST